MPWSVEKSSRCPIGKPWAVIKQTDGSVEGCHTTKQEAQAQQAALYAKETNSMDGEESKRWDGSAGRYTDEEYAKACVLDRNDCMDASEMSTKQRYSLPVANPGNSWSDQPDPAGVAAAAQRLSQVDAGPACKRKAASRLQRAYRKLDMDAPDSVKGGSMKSSSTPKERPSYFRAVLPGAEIRESPEGGPLIMEGYFVRYNEWTEIDSLIEGHFMERFAPGSMTKTLKERTPKVLFQHGQDGLGKQPIGKVVKLEETDDGVRYEVELYEGVPDLIISGLRDGAYGASFRFSVLREDVNRDPERSEHNPDAIKERTVREASVPEFGPVTFPAYAGATAGIRSVTDEFFIQRLATQPDRLRRLIDWLDADQEDREQETPPDEAEEQEVPLDAEDTHLERDDATPAETPEPVSTSPQGRRDGKGGMVLPTFKRPRKPGVLPNRDTGESTWSQIRLP